MSKRSRFEVLVGNHTHAGRRLALGEHIDLDEETAASYPQVFKRVGERPRTTAAKSRGNSNDAPVAEIKE